MRRLALAALAVIGLAPEARADREVESWLGTWTGKATWKGCTVEGAAELAVAVSWRDGSLWIDGAAIYEGLGEVAPEVREGGALVHDADGLTVELRRGKAGKATLSLKTAAKCTMTAKLERDGTGLPACDDLLALGRVAAACPLAVDDDPSDEVEGWRAVKKKARKRTLAQCSRRADALRERLVASDCLPPDDDPVDLPECRVVWRIAAALIRCGHLPVEFKQSTGESMVTLRRSLRSLAGKEGGDELAVAQCQETEAILRVNAEALHCQL
jgi:hypothetical protein